MFDFEKLIVYQKARAANKNIQNVLNNRKIRPFLRDQLYRAAISMVINIAEGTGKFAKNDRRNFYVISRGSVYECASLLDLLWDERLVSEALMKKLKAVLEEVSRLLSGLIRSL